MLSGKHIVVGISGGIAAYKIPLLIRLLRKAGAEVKTAVTENALNFVTEVTLETLSNNRVYKDIFAPHNEHDTEHISLPDWADLMIVAPATANIIGKMASGIADDALSTTFLAMLKPTLIVPAMNTNMYFHPAVQRNMQTLRDFSHITMMDAAIGELACGASGQGRMPEPEDICRMADYILEEKTLAGKHIVITAGPTIERIDPVRYISNFSSGKMAYQIAACCQRRGAEVTIVSGSVSENVKAIASGCKRVDIVSASEMYDATLAAQGGADALVLCAAVADYRPTVQAGEKIKRSGDDLTLTLTPNPDIAAAVGQAKRGGQVLIGFALETNAELENAHKKLEKKNLDMVVLNSLRDAGAGFGYDTNKVSFITRDGAIETTPLLTKREIAELITDRLENLLLC